MRAPSAGTRGVVIGAVVVAMAVILPLRGLYRAEGGSMEEGFMLVFPERLLAGDVPNVDFLHLYGPGSLWVLGAAFELFGVSIWVERSVGLFHNLTLIGGVFVFATRWGAPTATSCGLLAALVALTPIGLVALPWVGALGFVVTGTVLAAWALPRGPWSDRARWATPLGGVLLGFGMLYRPDIALAVLLAVGVLWWAGDRSRRLRLTTGVALGSLPMLVHLIRAGPATALHGMFTVPVFELRAGRRLPVPPSGDDLDGYLQKINELDTLDWPAPLNTPQQVRLWFFLLVAATVFIAVVAVLGARGRRAVPWRSQLLLAGAAIGLGILPQAIQRPDTTHLAWVGCFTLAVLPVAVVDLVEQRSWWRPRTGDLAAVAVALSLVLLAIPFFTVRKYADLSLQTFGRSRAAQALTHDGRVFYEGRADVPPAFEALAADVDAVSEPGDRLFVGPADLSRTPYVDSYLYHLFGDLEPATYYIEMDPGLADAPDSGLAEDLASADVVILSTLWDRWEEPNASIEDGSPEPERVLARQFCRRGTYGEPTIFELYTPC